MNDDAAVLSVRDCSPFVSLRKVIAALCAWLYHGELYADWLLEIWCKCSERILCVQIRRPFNVHGA